MKYEYDVEFEKNHKTKKGNTFHFKISANRLSLGLLFITCAILIILDAVGISLGFLSGIPAWVFIVGALNIVWLLNEVIKLKFSEIFLPVAFLFMLFEKYIARWCNLPKENIINNWLLLLCAILLTVGVKLLKPKKSRFISRRSKDRSFTSPSGSIHRNSAGGASTIYVDCESDDDIVEVINEFGACNIYFSNIEEYRGDKTLVIRNEFGAMKIHVPNNWRIVCNVLNELGAVNTPSDKDCGEKTIRISGTNNLGALSVVRS